MKFDFSLEFDRNKFFTRLDNLLKKESKVELLEIKPTRSIQHNKYLHVCISIFAIEYGTHLEDAKYFLKTQCSFMHVIENNKLKTVKTSTLNDTELSIFIEWIRNYASINLGLYIPTPEEYIENKYYIDKEIEKNKNFL